MTVDRNLVTLGIGLSPKDVLANATTQAKLLMGVVDQTKCFQLISGKKYLQVEAWETIGAFNRVHAVTESITPIMREDAVVGYDAKVNLINQDGIIVGSAIMPCYFTENACKGKEGDAKDKACKSAAQTFATSKAYRMNYSYIAILAGYEPLPAEEITEDMKQPEPNKKEHYCELHQVNFFLRGKMKSFAHPIGDTGEWCREHTKGKTAEKETETPAEAKETAPPKQPEPPQEGTKSTVVGFVDTEWLTASMKKLKWQEKTLTTWIAGKVKGLDCSGKLSDVLARMTREQAEVFTKELQSVVDLK